MALIEPRSADTRDVVRTDGHQLRPMAEDSPAAAGVNIQPGAQTLVSERLRTFGVPEAPVGRLRSPFLSLIFNPALPGLGCSWRLCGVSVDTARPPLDPLRVPSTELEDESDGRDVQCGAPGRRRAGFALARRGDLAGFRRELHTAFTARVDALFELTDAVLCAEGPVTSLVELTLLAEHRRGHGAMYDVLNQGRVDPQRLRRALAALRLPRAADGRIVLAVDVSPWLRPDAPTSADRLFCHVHGRGKGRRR